MWHPPDAPPPHYCLTPFSRLFHPVRLLIWTCQRCFEHLFYDPFPMLTGISRQSDFSIHLQAEVRAWGSSLAGSAATFELNQQTSPGCLARRSRRRKQLSWIRRWFLCENRLMSSSACCGLETPVWMASCLLNVAPVKLDLCAQPDVSIIHNFLVQSL